jgi:hypothetical protein
MENTLEGGARPVNENSMETLLAELIDLVRLLKPIAERVLESPHLFVDRQRVTGMTAAGMEAQAVVLASTIDRPNLNKIAKALGVSRSTAQRWRHLQAALDRVNRPSRDIRRGVVDSSGAIDGVD